MNSSIHENWTVRTKAIEPWMIGIRRRLHQCPELMFALPQTSAIVCQELEKLGISFESGIAETGVVASIGLGDSGCVMLRADMDALPIEELSDVEFRSRNVGAMHACGHDCHTAMLLAAARVLKEQESSLTGTVKLCFQPAEEGGAGAKRMCEAGVMNNPGVEKAFAIHVWPMLPTGQLTGRPGPFLAATSEFEITVAGTGGHAALPQFTCDPVTTTAKIMIEAQTLISREQDPLEAGVLSFTTIHGGAAHNVIPQTVNFGGTIRSLSMSNRNHLKKRLQEVAELIAKANRCSASFQTFGIDYPVTSNDPDLWRTVHEMGKRIVGDDNFQVCNPIMAGEDFAFYGAHAATSFVALGIQNEAKGCVYGLHHPQFKVDESALHLGAAMHVAFAMEHLGAGR